MLTVFSEALTGSSAGDKLGRLSAAFNISQTTSPDYHSFIRTLQEAYRKTKDDQRGETVPIDDLFKAILMTKSTYEIFAPLITQLDSERATPGQLPQPRRLDQPFVALVETFKKYYADLTSRKKVAAPTPTTDRKVAKPEQRPQTLHASTTDRNAGTCVICSHLPLRDRSHAHPHKECPVPGQLLAYEQLLSDMSKGDQRQELLGRRTWA